MIPVLPEGLHGCVVLVCTRARVLPGGVRSSTVHPRAGAETLPAASTAVATSVRLPSVKGGDRVPHRASPLMSHKRVDGGAWGGVHGGGVKGKCTVRNTL